MHSTFKQFARALPAVAMVTTIACSGGTPVAPDSATSAAAGSTDAGPDGSTLKATAPTLVSPINNVELATVRPSLQIGGSSAQVRQSGLRLRVRNSDLGRSDGSQADRRTARARHPATTSQTQSSYRWRARAVLGNSVGPWSDFATFRTISIPGCINGLLLDPAAYFFYVIKPQARATGRVTGLK